MSPPPAAVATAADLDLARTGGAVARRTPTQAVAQPVAAPAAAPVEALRERTLLGIGLILLSSIFFAATDVVAKMMAADLPAAEVAWIRYLVFMLLIVPPALAMRGREAFATSRPGLQVLRGLGMVGSSVIFILSLKYLPIADATATNFVGPIFITALSVLFLHEKVGLRRWIATVVGLIGVLVVVRPGPDILQSAGLLPALAALVWAGAAVATRMMAGTDRPETTLIYSAVTGFVALSLMLPFGWVTPTQHQVELGIVVGIGSTIGHAILVLAYRHATASLLAPFTYTQLVWASGFGFMAFGVLPTTWTVIGGTIIAASGLYIAHREHVRAREARQNVL